MSWQTLLHPYEIVVLGYMHFQLLHNIYVYNIALYHCITNSMHDKL